MPRVSRGALRPRVPAMGASLDEAERLLVSASWSRASDAAAAARRVARTRDERVAAECVWVQAEYKLGRLGASRPGRTRVAPREPARIPSRPRPYSCGHDSASPTPRPNPTSRSPPPNAPSEDIFPTADDEDDALDPLEAWNRRRPDLPILTRRLPRRGRRRR